jgi:hypothetical protein
MSKYQAQKLTRKISIITLNELVKAKLNPAELLQVWNQTQTVLNKLINSEKTGE